MQQTAVLHACNPSLLTESKPLAPQSMPLTGRRRARIQPRRDLTGGLSDSECKRRPGRCRNGTLPAWLGAHTAGRHWMASPTPSPTGR
eukprot:278994-Chlamydomonas_euryale.AAC.2